MDTCEWSRPQSVLMAHAVLLSAGHSFCTICISSHMHQHGKSHCPCCRIKIDSKVCHSPLIACYSWHVFTSQYTISNLGIGMQQLGLAAGGQHCPPAAHPELCGQAGQGAQRRAE